MNPVFAVLYLFLIFLFHRILAHQDLMTLSPAADVSFSKIFLVGMLSDFWIAAIVQIFLMILFRKKVVQTRAVCGSFLVIGFLTALHQSYTSFFKYQIVPFHLPYLWDPQFITANGVSSFDLKVILILFLSGFFAFLYSKQTKKKFRFSYKPLIAILALAVLAHVLQIRWRIQWFIPENLQSNYSEKFFQNLKASVVPPALTKSQSQNLADLFETNEDPLFLSPKISEISARIKKNIEKREKIFVITILMESFRPSEIGVYHQEYNKLVITPAFDALARDGILFTKAYSSGTVTRNAQEASWCGFAGGMNTSMMRSFQTLDMKCLPQAFKDKSGNQSKSFWLHGGDGRFDGQKSFWLRKGVDVLLSEQDFSKDIARTGWGVGDESFFDQALKTLQTSSSRINLAQLLTVTNHIPWDLPQGAIVSDDLRKAATHPSYITTAYSDQALGKFVTNLENLGMWENSLIFISSDHGNLEPPYYEETEKDPIVRAAKLSSHIALLVTGGVVSEKSVMTQKVSQVDIAQTIALIFDLPLKTMGDDLFNLERKKPVFADLGQSLYDTQNEKTILKNQIASEETLLKLYYRRFLDFIYKR